MYTDMRCGPFPGFQWQKKRFRLGFPILKMVHFILVETPGILGFGAIPNVSQLEEWAAQYSGSGALKIGEKGRSDLPKHGRHGTRKKNIWHVWEDDFSF